MLRLHRCIVEVGDAGDTQADLACQLKHFDPDGLIVRQGNISTAVQSAAKNLKVICKHGVGTDNIDVDFATNRGIPVPFTPQANSESVAEHTLGLMLSLLHKIPMQDKRIRDGLFDKKGHQAVQLQGKTVGLIAFGRFVRRVAELLEPFHVKVIVFRPSPGADALPQHVSRVQRSEELFQHSDIISLQCPLTRDTRNLINRETLALMKSGVFLINTARGAIIQERDLLQALRTGRVAEAALDVFVVEPPSSDHPC
ncbi:MAG: 3-phosphoglycerate dehydrogenase [Acidobacteriota bacterium]|nr:MAG: 3-phosphoglycerate dehydrogenase [Acidobacteriota bacterium]